jgi:UDP-2,3-diacylglucosamine pyrophosphatase LpxH
MQYIVISDLHIGADNSLSIFHAQEQLADFLRGQDAEPTVLIINGDSFDFLAVEPCEFSRAAAQIKVKAIIDTPANAALWQGFRDFLARNPQNMIDILLGNHDLEIVFDEVQTALRKVMALPEQGARVRFRLESVSYVGLEIGGVPVRLEHGFQFDPYNWYKLEDLLAATQGDKDGGEFTLPYGSRYVYDVLNHITKDHPFVPLLKPEPGVFFVLQALDPRRANQLLNATLFKLQPNRFLNKLRSWLRGIQYPAGRLIDMTAGAESLDPQLEGMAFGVGDFDKDTRDKIQLFLNDATTDAVAFDIISSDLKRQGRLALLRLALQRLQQQRNTFFDTENADADDFSKAHQAMIDGGYKVAVMGHTHARKFKRFKAAGASDEQAILYLNTGTWADLLDFDMEQLNTDEKLEEWLSVLENHAYTPELVLTFARLKPLPGGGLCVTLEEWDKTNKQARLVEGPENIQPVTKKGMTMPQFDITAAPPSNGQPDKTIYCNGINALTGGYDLTLSLKDLVKVIRGEKVEPKYATELKQRKLRMAGRLGVADGIDETDLAQTGWGVIFASDENPEVRSALKPLLDLRRAQASRNNASFYREFQGLEGQSAGYRSGESKREFLSGRNAPESGPADPANMMPYYLLIVGGPEKIPFDFQYQLDVAYAVGRIHFESTEDYATYAQNVVAAESDQVKLRPRAVYFAAASPDDKATSLSLQDLALPLTDKLQLNFSSWQHQCLFGEEASKQNLAQLLNGADAPALLFTASHGMAFPRAHELQTRHQGALLCSDWPGPEAWRKAITQDFYFSADDIQDSANLLGMIAFHFACYGAGTPKMDAFPEINFDKPKQIAEQGFIAALPKRMLSHKRGALAVIGHVERAWGYSFLGSNEQRQTAVFESAMKRLMRGFPVGAALEFFNDRYAELATDLNLTVQQINNYPIKPDEVALAQAWTEQTDARSYGIIGDPAVRLPVQLENKVDLRSNVILLSPPQVAPAPHDAVEIDEAEPPMPKPAAPADFGVLDSLDESRANSVAMLRKLTDKLNKWIGSFADDLTTLEVATYVSQDMQHVSQTDKDLSGKAQLRALTRIKLDGDIEVCLPAQDEAIDEALWQKHMAMVTQAQTQRTEMLKALVSAVSELSSVLKILPL